MAWQFPLLVPACFHLGFLKPFMYSDCALSPSKGRSLSPYALAPSWIQKQQLLLLFLATPSLKRSPPWYQLTTVGALCILLWHLLPAKEHVSSTLYF